MQSESVCFYSITKFVEFMKSKFSHSVGAIVYFEASNMFKNKFGKLCIKPVMLKVQIGVTTDKDVYIKHQKIIDMFEGQPIITFSEGKTRFMPKDKRNLYYLAVDFCIKEYNGIKYYPSEMFECIVKNNIKLIRDNIIKPSEAKEIIEEEIPPDAL